MIAITADQLGEAAALVLVAVIIALLAWWAVAYTNDRRQRELADELEQTERGGPRLAFMPSVTGDIPRAALAGYDASRPVPSRPPPAPPTLVHEPVRTAAIPRPIDPAADLRAELDSARVEVARLADELEAANESARILADEMEMRPRADPIVRRLREGPLTANLLAEEFGLDAEQVRVRMHYLIEVTRQVVAVETDREEDPVYIWKGVTTANHDDLVAGS